MNVNSHNGVALIVEVEASLVILGPFAPVLEAFRLVLLLRAAAHLPSRSNLPSVFCWSHRNSWMLERFAIPQLFSIAHLLRLKRKCCEAVHLEGSCKILGKADNVVGP
jgi:hypothetical protein